MQDSFAAKIRQSRPHQLSDPFFDFTPDYLRSLLAIRDEDFGWLEFQSLLGPYLPAGTYDESVYFLPRALEHLRVCEAEACDMVTAVVGFCSRHVDEVAADGYLPDVKSKLAECLNWWTRDFRIVNQSHVTNEQLVCVCLNDLVQFERLNEVGLTFFHQLIDDLSQPVAACWFIAFVRARNECRVSRPPTASEYALPLADPALLQRAAATVVERVPIKNDATYWNDTFRLVGL